MDIDVINTMGIGKIKIVMLKGEKGEQGAPGADGSSGSYTQLTNKPKINGVEVLGNHTSDYYSLASATAVQENTANISDLSSNKAPKNSPILKFKIGNNNTDASANPHVELKESGNSTDGWNLSATYVDSDGVSHANYIVDKNGNFLPSKAPVNHASAENTYGLGSSANYGHVKIENNLNQSAYAAATALSAYQGYLLNQNKANKNSGVLKFALGSNTDASVAPDAEIREVNGTQGKWLGIVYNPAEGDSVYNKLIDVDGSFIPSKAPVNHASADGTYGLATGTSYGHVKIVNTLDSSAWAAGEALSAKQGYELDQAKAPKKSAILAWKIGNNQTDADLNPHVTLREYGTNESGRSLNLVYTDAQGVNHSHVLVDTDGNLLPYNAPRYHADEADTYGLGSTTRYGHVKLINNLLASSWTAGEALTAHQGYLLKEMFDSISTDTVITDVFDVAANNYANGNISCTKSGYKAIGVVGYQVSGTGQTQISLSMMHVSSDRTKVYYACRNHSDTQKSITLTFYVLYVKA